MQHSQASMGALANRHGINPKTVVNCKRRTMTAEAEMDPKAS